MPYWMANIVPATPPIAAPTKNVVVMVLFTWIPSSALIVWFCDTQRIALPTFVRWMNVYRMASAARHTPTIRMARTVTFVYSFSTNSRLKIDGSVR